MLYREAGDFKTSYAKDNQTFPIKFDRVGYYVALIVAFLVVAIGGAWLAGSLLRLPRGDHISFLFAGSQKSVAVGAPLAALLFPPEVAGFVIAPLLLYHLLQLVIAAPLANMLASNS